MSAYANYAVDVESSNSSSYLNFYKKSFKLRKEIADFGVNATLEFIDSPAGTLTMKRGDSVLVVLNTNKSAVSVKVPAGFEIIQDSAGESRINGEILDVASESTLWLKAN